MPFGKYVKAVRLIDYSPHTLIDVGEVGRVIGEVEGLTIIKLLRSHPGLAPWGNKITLTLEAMEDMKRTYLPNIAKQGALACVCAGVGGLEFIGLPTLQWSNQQAHAVQAAEQALIEHPRTVERIIYRDGHIYFHRTRYAAESVVGVVIEAREITPDQVSAEVEGIKRRQLLE